MTPPFEPRCPVCGRPVRIHRRAIYGHGAWFHPECVSRRPKPAPESPEELDAAAKDALVAKRRAALWRDLFGDDREGA